jgi:hypothetical protein
MAQHSIFTTKRTLLTILSVSLFVIFLSSCKDDDDDDGSLVAESTIDMDTKQEIPTVANRNETGKVNLKLYGDSTLRFSISVSSLDGSDQLTLAHIHVGSPVDAGAPIVTLVDNSTNKFNGSKASGTVKLNTSQFNAVKEGGDFYVNVHSTKFPLGLIRGQLDIPITYAQNVDLTPMSNPLRPETGTAILRLAKDSTLYYKVTVNNLTQGDVLSAAQINVGAAGISGPSVISLYGAAADYGMAKTVKLNASQANFLLNSEVYVSVGSQQVASELLRGQIR